MLFCRNVVCGLLLYAIIVLFRYVIVILNLLHEHFTHVLSIWACIGKIFYEKIILGCLKYISLPCLYWINQFVLMLKFNLKFVLLTSEIFMKPMQDSRKKQSPVMVRHIYNVTQYEIKLAFWDGYIDDLHGYRRRNSLLLFMFYSKAEMVCLAPLSYLVIDS